MITEQLEKLLRDDERALAAAKKRLSRCAEGTIHVKRRKGTAAFYLDLPKGKDEKRREVHIPKQDKKLISSLCTKKYCRKLIPVLTKEIRLLKTFLEKFDPQEKHRVLQRLPAELAGHVSPLVKSNEQAIREWENAHFDANPYPLDHDSYLSKKGELVRSRLELITANMLHDLNIPYRYECALYLEDGSVCYPDFTILHPKTLKVYWLELFGMMDDPDYAAAALKKNAHYALSKVFSRLIMIFDHRKAPFRTETLEMILRNTFLD